jgi:phage I-like protein
MEKKQTNYIYALTNDIGQCPEEVKILPVGTVNSEKGDFIVDRESYKEMKAEMQRRGIDIVIDYEHQTLKDVQAPAGGWVKDLIYTPEAIIAKVEWTPKAKEYLKNKEYRYLSPVVLTRKSDSKAVVLHSLALTNTPAINGMFAIVNSVDFDTYNTPTGGKKMDLQRIKELLGLPAETPEEDVMNALVKVLEKAKDASDPKPEEDKEVVANSVILGLLELPADSKTEDVTTKIMALKAGVSQRDQEMKETLERLKQKEADDAVMMALKAGKITAAQKDWAKEYALKDRKGFDSFVEKAPAVVPVGKLDTTEAPKAKEKFEVDEFILKATGLSKEDLEKYADKEE